MNIPSCHLISKTTSPTLEFQVGVDLVQIAHWEHTLQNAIPFNKTGSLSPLWDIRNHLFEYYLAPVCDGIGFNHWHNLTLAWKASLPKNHPLMYPYFVLCHIMLVATADICLTHSTDEYDDAFFYFEKLGEFDLLSATQFKDLLDWLSTYYTVTDQALFHDMEALYPLLLPLFAE